MSRPSTIRHGDRFWALHPELFAAGRTVWDRDSGSRVPASLGLFGSGKFKPGAPPGLSGRRLMQQGGSVYVEQTMRGNDDMVSMTFGEMPSWREFAKAFKRTCPDGVFNVTTGIGGEPGLQRGMDLAGVQGNMLGYRDSYDFSARELYDVLNHMRDDWGTSTDDEPDEHAGAYLASSIMSILGYEWI